MANINAIFQELKQKLKVLEDAVILEGEVVYLVTCSLMGTTWRADAPATDNCVYFDTDDITWLEEPQWDERQIPGRDVLAQTFLGNGGEELSFTSSMNDEHARKQPTRTVDKQLAMLRKWNREGQVLQFVSTYHHAQMMCVMRSFQAVSPIAFSTDNYYDYTIKLREFSPLYIEYGSMGLGMGMLSGIGSLLGGLLGTSSTYGLTDVTSIGGIISPNLLTKTTDNQTSNTANWSLQDIHSDPALTQISNNVIKYHGADWYLTEDGEHVMFRREWDGAVVYR